MPDNIDFQVGDLHRLRLPDRLAAKQRVHPFFSSSIINKRILVLFP